jgi:hypothetical protein
VPPTTDPAESWPPMQTPWIEQFRGVLQASYLSGLTGPMLRTTAEASPSPDSHPRRSPWRLPLWGVATIAGVAVVALALAVSLQIEVESIQSKESSLGSSQLFDSTVNVSQELARGNASSGYFGSAGFQSPTGNGNPLVMKLTFLESAGSYVTLEFNICSDDQICSISGGSLDIVPLSPKLSETQIALIPATGSYELELLNLPAYADDSPVVPYSVSVNVTLEGQLDLH